MATATSKPVKRKVGQKSKLPDTCRLTVTIRGADYRARPIPNDAFAGSGRAWSLRKLGTDERHHVVETMHGAECDCPDFVFRRDGLDPAGCKHVRALRATGLIGGGS
jgi:hypothetical protein